MLHQLPPDAFARAVALFGDEQDHLAVVSALAGQSPAEVYVDDLQHPRAGLVTLWNDRLFLAGPPGDGPFARAVAALLRGRYTPPTAVGEPCDCTIAYTPAGWEMYLPSLFGDIASFRAEREYYRLRLTAPVVTPPLPPDFRLRRVDATLVADTSLGNHQLLLAETQSEAPSVADFLQHRFGYCIQHGEDLVAWCLSEYNHADRCELGIETRPPHQRRGLALAVAQATMAHAQRVGITQVGWHCWQRNLASSALARKLGFEKVRDYPVWYCRFGQPPTP